jgi:diguanylate cyclase (GGDEF)-like protein/PAS domain S-box-containing protein
VTVARHSRPVDDAYGRGVDAVAQLDQELARAHDDRLELQRELDRTRELVTAAQEAQARAEAQRDALWSSTRHGLALVEELGEFGVVNDALRRVLGRDDEAIAGRTVAAFVHLDDQPASSRPHFRRHSDPDRAETELRFVRPSGEVRWTSVTTTYTPGPSGQEWMLLCVDDRTDRRRDHQSLRDTEASLAALAKVTRQVQSGDDARSTTLAAVESMTGADVACLVEPMDESSWVITTSTASTLDGTTLPRTAVGAIAQAYASGEPLFLPDPTGSRVVAPAELAARTGSILWQPVLNGDQPVGVIIVKWSFRLDDLPTWTLDAIRLIADETAVGLAQEAVRAELQRLACTDALTGLPNRRAWDDQLAVLGEVAAVRGTPLVLAMVDLDHFKHFNDRHGHTAGDAHLRDFAARARDALRPCDLLTRWGGEEFTIAMPHCDVAQADALLRGVQHAVPGDQTCSIGWAFWDGRESLAAVMMRVDQSLYEAKAAGRGRIMSTERERVTPT